jgi:hypothetical protein
MAKNWIGKARQKMERKGTVGGLHRDLGVPAGKPIPPAKLAAGEARAERTDNTQLKRRIQFARNVRK